MYCHELPCATLTSRQLFSCGRAFCPLCLYACADKMRFPQMSSGEHGRTKSKNTHPPTSQPPSNTPPTHIDRTHAIGTSRSQPTPFSMLLPSLADENVIQSLISVERDETRKAFLNGISQYRKLNKTKTTFIDPFIEAAEEVRAHPIDPPSHRAIFCRSDTLTPLSVNTTTARSSHVRLLIRYLFPLCPPCTIFLPAGIKHIPAQDGSAPACPTCRHSPRAPRP